MGKLPAGSVSLADRRVGAGRQPAARRHGVARRACRARCRSGAVRGCVAADCDCGGSLRSPPRGALELSHRGRQARADALWDQLGCAALEPHRPRSSISPQLPKADPMSNLHAFDLLFIAVYFMILFGLAGTGAGSGLAVGHFEWLACLILLLLGWLFVPYYLKSGVYTMPEFLEKRYSSAARTYFTWVSVIGYVLTKISVTLYAGGVVIRAVTGWNFYTAAIVLIVVTGLYTVFGGLRAVVYTEVLQ